MLLTVQQKICTERETCDQHELAAGFGVLRDAEG